ncbi:hypothetical protein [Brachybacterium sp. GPGPB12]|uniref:hypothetical protein n=1 Tax=Brachybacterium sp. GPGPB12 TaxID=3023517 RepID=UPI0031342978
MQDGRAGCAGARGEARADHARSPRRGDLHPRTHHRPALAERFGLTSAAVRRHLAALEAEGTIAEHEVPVAHRGRGRPSKTFVLSPSAHEDFAAGYDELAVMAVDELARRGGEEAVTALAERRISDWEQLARRTGRPPRGGDRGAGGHRRAARAALAAADRARLRHHRPPAARPAAGGPSRRRCRAA